MTGMKPASILRVAPFLATLFLILPAPTARALAPADEPLVKVVETVRPAVVNINTERIVQQAVETPESAFFGRYYLVPRRQKSLGSGVLVGPEGYILTCAHVVGRAGDTGIKVTLSDGSVLPAKLLSSDEDADLALLQVEAKKPFPFVSLAPADLSPNLLGQTVVALGDPVGYQSSVSAGILSAKERTVRTGDGEVAGLLQTDAAINPGNSGGPLVDIQGKFVGLCNAKLSGEAVEGIGFAIPGVKVAAWLADAVAVAKGEKKPTPPVSLLDIVWDRFGVRFQAITPDLAEAFNLPSTNGLLVADVDKGSPADRVGMANGMVLVALGQNPILNEASLPRELRNVKKGDRATFTLAIIERRGDLAYRRSRTVELIAR